MDTVMKVWVVVAAVIVAAIIAAGVAVAVHKHQAEQRSECEFGFAMQGYSADESEILCAQGARP